DQTNLEKAVLERACFGPVECTFKTNSITSFSTAATFKEVNFKGTNVKGASFKGIDGETIPWETMELCNTILPDGVVSDRDCGN
ncbi:MAG: hypothetical protein F6K44_34735, partial [Moorea sp. SIO3E2]|nr:hypothetical protein [Moorena sp. SIO3E2]